MFKKQANTLLTAEDLNLIFRNFNSIINYFGDGSNDIVDLTKNINRLKRETKLEDLGTATEIRLKSQTGFVSTSAIIPDKTIVTFENRIQRTTDIPMIFNGVTSVLKVSKVIPIDSLVHAVYNLADNEFIPLSFNTTTEADKSKLSTVVSRLTTLQDLQTQLQANLPDGVGFSTYKTTKLNELSALRTLLVDTIIPTYYSQDTATLQADLTNKINLMSSRAFDEVNLTNLVTAMFDSTYDTLTTIDKNFGTDTTYVVRDGVPEFDSLVLYQEDLETAVKEVKFTQYQEYTNGALTKDLPITYVEDVEKLNSIEVGATGVTFYYAPGQDFRNKLLLKIRQDMAVNNLTATELQESEANRALKQVKVDLLTNNESVLDAEIVRFNSAMNTANSNYTSYVDFLNAQQASGATVSGLTDILNNLISLRQTFNDATVVKNTGLAQETLDIDLLGQFNMNALDIESRLDILTTGVVPVIYSTTPTLNGLTLNADKTLTVNDTTITGLYKQGFDVDFVWLDELTGKKVFLNNTREYFFNYENNKLTALGTVGVVDGEWINSGLEEQYQKTYSIDRVSKVALNDLESTATPYVSPALDYLKADVLSTDFTDVNEILMTTLTALKTAIDAKQTLEEPFDTTGSYASDVAILEDLQSNIQSIIDNNSVIGQANTSWDNTFALLNSSGLSTDLLSVLYDNLPEAILVKIMGLNLYKAHSTNPWQFSTKNVTPYSGQLRVNGGFRGLANNTTKLKLLASDAGGAFVYEHTNLENLAVMNDATFVPRNGEIKAPLTLPDIDNMQFITINETDNVMDSGNRPELNMDMGSKLSAQVLNEDGFSCQSYCKDRNLYIKNIYYKTNEVYNVYRYLGYRYALSTVTISLVDTTTLSITLNNNVRLSYLHADILIKILFREIDTRNTEASINAVLANITTINVISDATKTITVTAGSLNYRTPFWFNKDDKVIAPTDLVNTPILYPVPKQTVDSIPFKTAPVKLLEHPSTIQGKDVPLDLDLNTAYFGTTTPSVLCPTVPECVAQTKSVITGQVYGSILELNIGDLLVSTEPYYIKAEIDERLYHMETINGYNTTTPTVVDYTYKKRVYDAFSEIHFIHPINSDSDTVYIVENPFKFLTSSDVAEGIGIIVSSIVDYKDNVKIITLTKVPMVADLEYPDNTNFKAKNTTTSGVLHSVGGNVSVFKDERPNAKMSYFVKSDDLVKTISMSIVEETATSTGTVYQPFDYSTTTALDESVIISIGWVGNELKVDLDIDTTTDWMITVPSLVSKYDPSNSSSYSFSLRGTPTISLYSTRDTLSVSVWCVGGVVKIDSGKDIRTPDKRYGTLYSTLEHNVSATNIIDIAFLGYYKALSYPELYDNMALLSPELNLNFDPYVISSQPGDPGGEDPETGEMLPPTPGQASVDARNMDVSQLEVGREYVMKVNLIASLSGGDYNITGYDYTDTATGITYFADEWLNVAVSLQGSGNSFGYCVVKLGADNNVYTRALLPDIPEYHGTEVVPFRPKLNSLQNKTDYYIKDITKPEIPFNMTEVLNEDHLIYVDKNSALAVTKDKVLALPDTKVGVLVSEKQANVLGIQKITAVENKTYGVI